RKPESGNPTFRACRGARGNVILSCQFDTVSAPRLYPDHVRFCERLGVQLPGPTPLIVFHEPSLRRILASYFQYYHRSRTHLSLEKDSPAPRSIQSPEMGRVVALPHLGGLHHRYERRAV